MSRRDHGQHARGATTASKRPALNEYWIDGDGILRDVLQSEICRFLGAEATCRPGDLNGRSGYKIRALRPFTPEMLEDLREASRDYRSETRALQDRYDKGIRGNSSSPKGSNKRIAVSYEDSETRRRNDPQLSQHYQSSSGGGGSGGGSGGYSAGSPYTESSQYSGMPSSYGAGSSYPSSGSGYPPAGGQYPPGGAYGSMAPSMSSTPSYAGSADPRYQPHYTYVNQPPRGDYQPPSRYGYAPEPSYAEPPRSRGDPVPGAFAYERTPSERPPMGGPARGDYDYEMGGTSVPHGYNAPPRGQAPSPYDNSREHYPPRPQTDPYSGNTRRR